MEPVIQHIEAEPEHTVEVVVRIPQTHEEQQRNNMIVALENNDRIYSVEFCPSSCHLMLVKYDRDQYSSADVLSSITSRNVSAKLIGPV